MTYVDKMQHHIDAKPMIDGVPRPKVHEVGKFGQFALHFGEWPEATHVDTSFFSVFDLSNEDHTKCMLDAAFSDYEKRNHKYRRISVEAAQ